MLKNFKPDLTDYFGLQTYIFKFVGFSLNSKEPIAFIAFACLIWISMFIYPFLVLPELFKKPDDLDEFINNLLFETAVTIVLVKVSTFTMKRVKLRHVLKTLQEGVFLPNENRGGSVEKIMIDDCINYTRRQSIISATLAVLITVLGLVSFCVMRTKDDIGKYPFGTFPPFSSPYNFEIVCFYQFVVYVIVAVAFTMGDVLYASILSHICVQCQLLQNCVQKLIENSHKDMMKETKKHEVDNLQEDKIDPSSIPWKYFQKRLKEAVIYHHSIINIAQETEEAFNVAVLGEFVGCTVCVCFLMYNGSLRTSVDIKIINDLILLFGSVFPMSIISFWGNKVITDSETVNEACYNLNFVGSDVKFQKGLMLIMNRSQKPLMMTVGKFANLSLVTFVGVLRASYSYFAVLQKVHDD